MNKRNHHLTMKLFTPNFYYLPCIICGLYGVFCTLADIFSQFGCSRHFRHDTEAAVMQNYTDSDYARNKNSASIVYRFADGTFKELTLENFLTEDPEMTEEEFFKWKQISDNDYYLQDRIDYQQTWKNVPIDTAPEITESIAPSPDEAVIETPYKAEQKRKRGALGKKAWGTLTYLQRKRFRMYHAERMTEEQIAAVEGIAHQTVSRSLLSAKRKLEKFLKIS